MKKHSLLNLDIFLILMLSWIAAVLALCAQMCCSDCIAVLGYTIPASAFSAGLSAFEYIERTGFLHHFASIPISAQRYLIWHGFGFVVSAGLSVTVAITAIRTARTAVKQKKCGTAAESADGEQIVAVVNAKMQGGGNERQEN